MRRSRVGLVCRVVVIVVSLTVCISKLSWRKQDGRRRYGDQVITARLSADEDEFDENPRRSRRALNELKR